MTALYWTIVACVCLDIVGQAAALAAPKIEPRAPEHLALALVLNAFLLAWIVAVWR